MKNKGIVLSGHDEYIETKAKNIGLPVIVDSGLPVAFGKVLFVEKGIKIPWDLLNAAWLFLDRWDAVVPLYRYGVSAEDIGTSEERKRTKEVIRDLRVLLHSPELLFIANNEAGNALRDAYVEECADSSEKRLAFLRAIYRIKPRLCVLPTSWLFETHRYNSQRWNDLRMRGKRTKSSQLVVVEVSPGRFVKCNPGDEERVLQSLKRVVKAGGRTDV